MGVCVWGGHLCGEARGQPQPLQLRVSHWLGTCPVGEAGWPGSPRHFSVSTSLAQGS